MSHTPSPSPLLPPAASWTDMPYAPPSNLARTVPRSAPRFYAVMNPERPNTGKMPSATPDPIARKSRAPSADAPHAPYVPPSPKPGANTPTISPPTPSTTPSRATSVKPPPHSTNRTISRTGPAEPSAPPGPSQPPRPRDIRQPAPRPHHPDYFSYRSGQGVTRTRPMPAQKLIQTFIDEFEHPAKTR